MRSDWTFPLCTGEERLKGADGKKLHPTQKPEALLARVILSASRPDDLVLDPFNGTGTTGAVAKRLGRRFIGIEREAKYAKAAEKRIAGVQVVPSPSIAPFVTAREAPRVAFSALIERGLVSPGALLVDAKKRHKATVRADGAVSLGDNGRLDPPHRRAGARSGSLQRLDLLACANAEGPQADRRTARGGALRDGGSGGVVRFIFRPISLPGTSSSARLAKASMFARRSALPVSNVIARSAGASNRHTTMTRRIAVAVAGRPGSAGFAKTPGRAMPLAHAPRDQ